MLIVELIATTTLENSLIIFTKAMLTSAYDPTTYTFVYVTETRAYVHQKTQMFIVILFIIAPNWKQPYIPQQEDE